MPLYNALLRPSGIIALPGYSVFITPWTGSKANNNMGLRFQDSGVVGGGYLGLGDDSSGAAFVEWDVWLDVGTYKIVLIYRKGADLAIATFKFNGVSQGTIDMYAAVTADNTYAELTGIIVASGLKTFRLENPTKNASSTNFHVAIESIAIIRTGV
jgi:hypothetical protein